jgi:hypothetical protein
MGDATSPARPTAEGTLAMRPLSHLLVYVRSKRLTGRLTLRAPDGAAGAIALWRGQIAAARTLPPTAYFGAVASAMGLVDETTSAATQREAVEKKKLHGEILVAHGKLTGAQRDAVLAEQTCRKVHHLFPLPPATVFSFYEERATANEPVFMLDPVAPLWRGIRDGTSTDDPSAVLATVAKGAIRLVNEAPIARAGLSAEERAICEALAGRPMTFAQMHAAFRETTPEHLDRLVYLLILTKSAEPVSPGSEPPPVRRRTGSLDADAIAEALKGSRRPPVTPSSASNAAVVIPPAPARSFVTPPPARLSAPAPAAPPAAPAGRVTPSELGAAGIALRAETVEDEDPFVTLGLPANAAAEAARSAYFHLVKTWHPDRLPSELASVRNEVGKIFTQMTNAHRVLTDDTERRAFIAARDARAAALHRPRGVVVRLIDTAISKKDFSFAADEARKLIATDRNDAEAHALLAWIATSAGEGAEPSLRAALVALDRVVGGDSQCVRAFHYRGLLHKRLGNTAAAHRDFARAVKLDPSHVDATRELRIFEMRMKT